MLLFMKTAQAIVLTPEEAQTLDSWAASRTLPQRVVQRARLVRMAADGIQSQEIAKQLDVSRPTVQLWREQFLALRLPGLERCAPPRPHPADIDAQGRRHRERDTSDYAGERHPLEHADHGRGAGVQRGHSETYLARAQAQAPPGGDF